ncbi:MAG: hypothetical protein ACLQVF_07310, partial [Isosphaeraceae bacterium]
SKRPPSPLAPGYATLDAQASAQGTRNLRVSDTVWTSTSSLTSTLRPLVPRGNHLPKPRVRDRLLMKSRRSRHSEHPQNA